MLSASKIPTTTSVFGGISSSGLFLTGQKKEKAHT
jgi:hypothetical protein